MKGNLTLSKTSALLALMMFFFVISCKKDERYPKISEPKTLEANLFESSDLFAAALENRQSAHVFEIKDITRKDATLQVKVKGGGLEESFKFIWDGSILESYPMRVLLVLKYDNHRNDFDKDKEFVIHVNLEKILGTAGNPKDFHFSLINGSQMQQKNLNPDGSVSSNE